MRATVTVAGVPGVEIAYHRKGAGEPLLLLHGIGHHRQAFDPVLDRLAEHRDVIALDFPGFGESPDGRRVMTGAIYHRPALRDPDAVVAETRALRDAPAFDRVAAHARTGITFTGDVPDIPVTIAWGTHDRVLIPTQAARAHLQLPRARSIPLLNCGHVPMNDNPALVATTILGTT